MATLNVWLRDRVTGYYAGELDSVAPQEAIDDFYAALPADREAIDKATHARPPDRPPTPEQVILQEKRDRLGALRAAGWTNLSAEEKAEAQGLGFDLSEYVPTA